MSPSRWKDKNAVVLGATSGLGRQLAVQLALGGVRKLVVVARGREALDSLTDSLREAGKNRVAPTIEIHSLSIDVCQKDALQQGIADIEVGGIDLVINAVGKSDRGTIDQLAEEQLSELHRLNVGSSLNAIQCFEGSLAASKGVLVLIGSLASLFAPRYLGGYAIAKHGVAALAQQARLEMADLGVHVMLACPGPIVRPDAGTRYQESGDSATPSEALQPGGGAKLKGLDSTKLALDILRYASARKRILVRPRSARLLQILGAVSPWLGDTILRKKTS